MPFDNHGRFHVNEIDVIQANARINQESLRAQEEAARNTRATLVLAERQALAIQDKARYDRIVSFLDGETNENKWAVILKETKPDIVLLVSKAAEQKIQIAWGTYLKDNNRSESLTQFRKLYAQIEALEKEITKLEKQKMYPISVIDESSKTMSRSMAIFLAILLLMALWPVMIPILAVYAFLHRPSRMKKLIAIQQAKVEEMKERKSLAYQKLKPSDFSSDDSKWKTAPESCLESVWCKIDEWQSDYPPRCRVQRDDKPILTVITAVLNSVNSDFQRNMLRLIYG